jgi:Tfp pilus assembly protein PilX
VYIYIQGGAEPTDTFKIVIDNIWKEGKKAKPSVNMFKYAIYYPHITSLFSANYRIFSSITRALSIQKSTLNGKNRWCAVSIKKFVRTENSGCALYRRCALSTGKYGNHKSLIQSKVTFF